jgi:hypothetical protein
LICSSAFWNKRAEKLARSASSRLVAFDGGLEFGGRDTGDPEGGVLLAIRQAGLSGGLRSRQTYVGADIGFLGRSPSLARLDLLE